MNKSLSKEQLNELKPYFLDRLKELLQIPSTYDETSIREGAPYGENIQKALEYALSLGEKEGFSVKDIDGYAGHIEWGKGEELIGILGHLDVVPAGEGWTNGPFDPVVKEGKLFARGAQDDKGPVMAAFLAMKWLKDIGVEPQKRVRLILGTDEERNWGCMKHYFAKEEMPKVGFSPDAQFPVIHAEKGLLDLDVTKNLDMDQSHATAQLLHLQGGERLNMVPYRAQASLKWEGEGDPISLFEDFIQQTPYDGKADMDGDQLHITLTGKSAHAMEPNNGHNAFLGITSFLKELPFSNSILSVLYWIEEAFQSSRGEGLGIACEDNVSGPLTVNVGTAVLKDGDLTLGLNIRYPVTKDFQEWFQIFESNMNDHEARIHVIEHLEAIHMAKDHPFVEKLLDIYNRNANEQAEPLAIGGATYARALNQGVAYGAMFSHSPDTAHNADEHILIEDLMEAAYIYAEAIYELITT
ncbi:dipeptidase PepV [Pontibacillus marinus]|uniref:Diguanylate cyclase n=1 Tax=Pontibacillus marinus BH030004 = DSM 16465 TaxID=1385511 RepID=A0A0A5HKA9_9BACI|nr:dipeptidase PepV [Pontibacillus marinus]KGX84042.1 hypothetical protein N783_19405 [Pontibacillus marinus BH030004 = DSM 16465]